MFPAANSKTRRAALGGVLRQGAMTAVLIGLFPMALWAEPPRPSAAAKQEAEALPAQNVVQLRRHVGKSVTVRGRIARTSKAQGAGHQFLNFDGSELTAICFAEDIKNFPDGAPVELFRDRTVELTGKLELYRDKLQIKLRDPKQIRIVEDSSPGSNRSVEPIELKPLGPGAWVSPAGLRYVGRDPAGRTRLDHVRLHFRDEPDRDGSHGVFDGEEGEALAVIDEAWQEIQERKTAPRVESGRAAYVVSLGRRIGYLGGRTGAQRDHPALSRVMIVVEEGTSNLVTAYPY
jgi:hypothetical protein